MKIKTLIKFKRKNQTVIYLILIIAFAFSLRIFNISWDSGDYFHPDERAIVMQALPLTFPHNFPEFLNPNSPLNTHFFAYGNFPIYLLKIASELFGIFYPIIRTYSGIYLVGRLLSALFDTLSIITIFFIGKTIFSKKSGILAALLYSLFVFPIQSAHFFTVDPMLTFFMLTSFLFGILFFKKPSFKSAVLTGIFWGLALSTKISALVLLPSISVIYLLSLLRQPKHFEIKKIISSIILTFVFSAIVFAVTQPYVIIDWQQFKIQTTFQSQMSNNAFLFPYTLQYVGKIPYIYELKNIIFWGVGPIAASICILGIILVLYFLIKKKFNNNVIVFFTLFYLISYFLVFGKFAVGWMRYMLPIYPIFAVFGGWLVADILAPKIPKKYIKNYLTRKIILLMFLLVLSIYPASFLSIYSKPNTRLQATEWILKNIHQGSRIATEHWDDGMPIYGGERYQIIQLPLYETDTTQKWNTINQTLKSTDYIIIASTRLYVPLQKLANCSKLPPFRCYSYTALYYKNLFSGKLGFKKIAEFEEKPTIPFINIKIDDQFADESFTVYDHPKIMIFKKE